MVEKEDLEFFKEECKADDFFKKFGYRTGPQKFGELIQEGFLEKKGQNYILSDIGKTQLMISTPEQNYAKLRIISKKAKEILKEKQNLGERKIDVDLHEKEEINSLLYKLRRREKFLIGEFNEIAKDLGFKEVKNIHSLEIELSSILVDLENRMPKIKDTKTNIEPLRERITSLNFDDITEKNLLLSLKGIESQNFLGSFLISGRIIAHFITKIKGETKEEKLGVLEKESIIRTKKEDKDRADKKMFSKLLESHMPNKKYRDFASHHITYFPDMEEAMRELTNAIEISKRVKNLIKN